MARDHADRPMTDDELAEVSEAIPEQSEGVDVSTWNDNADAPTRGADRDAADSD